MADSSESADADAVGDDGSGAPAQYHLGVDFEAVADSALLPGDPERVPKITSL